MRPRALCFLICPLLGGCVVVVKAKGDDMANSAGIDAAPTPDGAYSSDSASLRDLSVPPVAMLVTNTMGEPLGAGTTWGRALSVFASNSIGVNGSVQWAGDLTTATLAGSHALFLIDPWQGGNLPLCPSHYCLSASGAQDIVNWVSAGNCLYVSARTQPYTPLFNLIGVNVTGNDGGVGGGDWPLTEMSVSVTGAHPLAAGVKSLHGDVGGRATVDGNWTVLSGAGDVAYLAVRNLGAGKIVLFWAQQSFLDPGVWPGELYKADLTEENNAVFLGNIISWFFRT